MSWIKKLFGQSDNKCLECGMPMQLAALASCQGRHNGVSVRFEGLPYFECSNRTHSRREPRPDFGQYLIEEIYINDQIPWAEPGAFDHLKCLACKTKIEAADYKAGEITGDILVKDLPPFKAHVQATVGLCPKCGARQLVSEETTLEDVNGAIQLALRDARLVVD